MGGPQPSPSRLTRRGAMGGIMAGALGLAAPSLTAGAEHAALHEQVARQVRDLAGGRSIRLRLLLPHGSVGNVQPVIAAFRRMTGVEVGLHETDVDEINSVLTLDALSFRQSYDVALPATFGLSDLVAAGAVLPLAELAARYEPGGFRDDILFATGDSFDGQLYGFQTDGDAYLMFYHRDMLSDPEEQARYADRFGTPLDLPLTWEELDGRWPGFTAPSRGVMAGFCSARATICPGNGGYACTPRGSGRFRRTWSRKSRRMRGWPRWKT